MNQRHETSLLLFWLSFSVIHSCNVVVRSWIRHKPQTENKEGTDAESQAEMKKLGAENRIHQLIGFLLSLTHPHTHIREVIYGH